MYCLNSVQAYKLAQRGAFQMCFGAFAPCVHSLVTTLDQLSACLGNLTYSDRLGNPSASLLFPCELFLPPKGFFHHSNFRTIWISKLKLYDFSNLSKCISTLPLCPVTMVTDILEDTFSNFECFSMIFDVL